MFIVYVKHYLNHDGIQYFYDTWFPKVETIMSQQEGYISVKHEVERDSNDCVNVIVTFNDKENLEQWAKHRDHDELVNALDSYRCRKYWEFSCAEDESICYETLKWIKVEPQAI